MSFVVLIGASGSGKTTIARAIANSFPEMIEVLFFDSIGVPSREVMAAEYGSAEGWQLAKTIEWMIRGAQISRSGRPVILEGQTRLSFLEQGASTAGLGDYLPILIDCDDTTRSKRLRVDRQQPELANVDMMKWAEYLRRDALDKECKILNTSELSIDQAVSVVVKQVLRTP